MTKKKKTPFKVENCILLTQMREQAGRCSVTCSRSQNGQLVELALETTAGPSAPANMAPTLHREANTVLLLWIVSQIFSDSSALGMLIPAGKIALGPAQLYCQIKLFQ